MIPEIKKMASAIFRNIAILKNKLVSQSLINLLEFRACIFSPRYLPANIMAGKVILTNSHGIFSLAKVYRIKVIITQYANKTEKASLFLVSCITANAANNIGRYS